MQSWSGLRWVDMRICIHGVAQVEREKLQLALLKEMVGSLEDEYDYESDNDVQQTTKLHENIEHPQASYSTSSSKETAISSEGHLSDMGSIPSTLSCMWIASVMTP